MAPGPAKIRYAGMRMTADEYLALGETFEDYELIDGVVLEHERRSVLHQAVVAEIAIQAYGRGEGARGRDAVMRVDVRFSDSIVYCPDVLAYRPGRVRYRDEVPRIAPDLIVEVMSTYSYSLDLVTKRGDYERFEVGEYWVFDLGTGNLHAFRRSAPDRKYVESIVTADSFASGTMDGFTLDLRPLREMLLEANTIALNE